MKTIKLNYLIYMTLIFLILSCSHGIVKKSSDLNGTTKLQWNPSTTPVQGYKIYYGKASGAYTEKIDVGNTTTYNFPHSKLTPGLYYFAIKAYDAKGVESAFSNEAALELGLKK